MTGSNTGTDWQKQIADRDARIAELEGQVAEAAKNAETAEQLRGEIAELKAQGESDRIDFRLQLAGVRSVKAARALLSDHDNLELGHGKRSLNARAFSLTHESAETAFKEIASTRADDDWEFEFIRTEDIRETDNYPGIRVHLLARYAPMEVPLTIDVTTGDRITPGAVEYEYPLLFDDRSILLLAYPLGTVLAEKLETAVSRGAGNTRPRDFYDIHVLWQMKGTECDLGTLREALAATCAKRGSAKVMGDWDAVLSEVAAGKVMQGLWAKYVRLNSYAVGIALEETCETARGIMRAIGWNEGAGTDAQR